jgi:multiple sugar transport system ATP-binding protein
MTMGDNVAVMNRGVLQQVDPPQRMYDQPANLFVAGFIGSPAMNMVEATLARADGGRFAGFGGLRLRVPDETLSTRPALGGYVGKGVVLGIRPEDIEDPQFLPAQDAEAQVTVVVAHREAMGAEVYAHFTVDAAPVVTEDTRDLVADTGADVADHESAGATTFIARLHPRTSATRGKPITLQVDTRTLHVFDPATGQALG